MVGPELVPTRAAAATIAAGGTHTAPHAGEHSGRAARATHTDRRAGAPAAQPPRTTEDPA